MYNNALDPSHYEFIKDEVDFYNSYQNKLSGLFNGQHQHRSWEYGIGIKLAKELKGKTLLDVGGGGSIFPQCCTGLGYTVDVVDMNNAGSQVEQQNIRMNHNLVNYYNEDFLKFNVKNKYDLVVAISTIEHVPDDMKFYEKMLNSCKKMLYLTCDFYTSEIHPNEPPIYKEWVNRTYTKEKLTKMVEMAKIKGFKTYSKPNWNWVGSYVYNYNFASLCMIKV